MKILISTLVHDRNAETLKEVARSIEAAITNTIHECNSIIVTDESIHFDESKFNRLTSFSVNGYDEFQLHKISELRNLCMTKAIEGDYDCILFVDSDNIIPSNAIDLLVDSGKQDISGWYYCKNVPLNTAWQSIADQKEPFTVEATACGCRLIRSEIFRSVKFVYANLVSEELQFSKDVEELGFKTWIHPLVYSDHIGGGYTDEARTYREAQLNK